MKLPNFLRLNKGDYDEENRPVVGRMADSLNPSIEVLYNALNNRLTTSENMAAVIKDVVVTVDADGFPLTATGIALGTIVPRAIGSIVLRAINQTNPSLYATSQPFISFTQNGQTFEIDHITGLPAGNQFLLTIEVKSA